MTNGQARAKCQLRPPASQPPSRAHSGNGWRPTGSGSSAAPRGPEMREGVVDLEPARDHPERAAMALAQWPERASP